MNRFSLELTLTATEGSVHNLGNVVCLAWLSASTYNPLHQTYGKAAVLARTVDSYGELAAREFTVPTIALAEIVKSMQQLELPGRSPQVQARSGNPSGWQNLVLDVFLNGSQGRVALTLQYGGLDGDDAGAIHSLLTQLFVLLDLPQLQAWIN